MMGWNPGYLLKFFYFEMILKIWILPFLSPLHFKNSLNFIPSPSPSVKIQIMGGKVCLTYKGKTLLGVVKTLFVFKSLLTRPSNVLPLQLKQIFPPIIWIFTEGDGIEYRLPFKIFSTLLCISCTSQGWALKEI